MTKTQMLSRLAALVARRESLETEIDGLVDLLKSPDMTGQCEATWQEVATALGVTRQAAQQRYRHHSWAGDLTR